MTYIKPILFAAAAASYMIAAPANATTQNDVQLCRAAYAAQSKIDLSTYRLRFERKEGVTEKRARTLFLKAISTDKTDKAGKKSSFRITCHLNKNTVIALNSDKTVLYAAR